MLLLCCLVLPCPPLFPPFPRNPPPSNCVKLKEWFNYRGHVCMVFEKLGPSLYDYLRRNEYQPLPLALVQVCVRERGGGVLGCVGGSCCCCRSCDRGDAGVS